MREIKFRAWDKKNKTMVRGESLVSENVFISPANGNLVFSYNAELYLMDNFELMQYIGLKDKNGKEIYEGDLLRDNRIDVDDIYQVCWNSYSACFMIELEDEYLHQILDYVEVVGNIYENPELLEANND